ncbi:MAG: transcriptional repressor [Woronichinia naegeliana WA131]|jgi:Fur family ferric uptake transcriptional regulator|uniref:Transcriptional repressor n=1 Tax=Woronichinia naegeliana WA131 TaxID=2824559 RepID=A0A977PTQ1_9CYAN|nr:MAG: transcriptional repressor [Woronichinia naegeliana WA131]
MKAQRTRSQERIFCLLKTLHRAVSAQELYLELRQRQESIGLATVYRALEGLKLQGAIQCRTLTTGESLYSLTQQDQHHLTCVNCGASIAISECPVRELENSLERSHQFKVYYHTLEFFGICHRCQLQTAQTIESAR